MGNTALLQGQGASGPALTDREKEMQTAIWSLLFITSEICVAIRALRDRLHARGVLLPEDEELVNKAAIDPETLARAYQQLEKGFREKFARIQYAAEHPEEVERSVREMQEQQLAERENLTPPAPELREVFGNTAEAEPVKGEPILLNEEPEGE